MDFARPHRLEEGVATKSGIKILEEGELPPLLPSNQFTGATVPGVPASTLAAAAAAGGAARAEGDNGGEKNEGAAAATSAENGDKAADSVVVLKTDDEKLDKMLLNAANRAAKDMFLGPPATKPKLHPCVEAEPSAEDAEEGNGGDNSTDVQMKDAAADDEQDVEDGDGHGNCNDNGGNGSNGDGGQACLAEDSEEAEEDRPLRLADSRLYPERCLAPSQIIAPNSLVVIFESFDSLSFTYATPGQTFSNRNGHFAHDDFIGKPYGCKVRSRSSGGLGYVYLLRPTPELWTRSLPHRTQIIHELDAAVIVCQLNLRPNCVVCESGTGSGSMSHSILRTIAPRGKLHTYEFNKSRVLQARDDFRKNGVGHLVDVHWRDVCGKEDAIGGGSGANLVAATSNDPENQTRIEKGGFGLGPAKAHAIFLDLPEPWLAVPHVAHTIVPGGRLGSYSPCIEQSQKLIAAIKEHGFHSVRTIEVRLREHHVDEIELEPPPFGRLPRDPPSQAPVPTAAAKPAAESGAGSPPTKKPRRVPSTVSGNSAADFSGEDTGAEADTERSEAETEGEPPQRADVLIAAARSAQEHGAGLAPVVKKGSRNGGGHRVAWDDGGSSNWSNTAAIGAARKRKLLVARPFATMRGHTAFLTFATAGNKSWPDPNEEK